MIPIVMAGGFGTRIRPLSANRPKPMLPVANRPMLEHVLHSLRRAGFDEAVLLLYHQPEVVTDYFGDGSRCGLKLHYYTADADYGTAGAARKGAELAAADGYLVLSGDVVCDFDLARIVEEHRSRGAEATITLTRVANPLQFGIVITDKEGRVTRFMEKPTWGEVFSDTINTGIYVLEASALESVEPDTAYDFSKDLFPKMLKEGRALFGTVQEGYWRDVGDPDAYIAVHHDICAGTVRGIEVPGEPLNLIGRDVRAESPVDLTDVELRGTVVLGRDVTVGRGARLENCVIGPGAVIGAGAEVRGGVVWAGASIGDKARVESAVVCERAEIGELSVLEPGSVVADGSRLGREVRVREGVKIWPRKVVEDFAVVHTNMVWATRWRTSAFDESAVVGLTNYELTPEVAAKLGAAYGAMLPEHAVILTSRDAHPASRMLRRAFVGGVGSAGVDISDLRMTPIPIMRFRLQQSGTTEVGGVFFQQVHLMEGMTAIRFYDAHGSEISTDTAKSIERVFFREDFRRVDHDRVGVIHDYPALVAFYQDAYLANLNRAAVRERNFRVVVDYSHSSSAVVLPTLLARLSASQVTLNAQTEGGHRALQAGDMATAQEQLASIVHTLKADLGVWIEPGSERLVLADRRGRCWRGTDLLMLLGALLARMPLEDSAGRIVILPGYAPSPLIRMFESSGFAVQKVSSDPREIMRAASAPGVLFASSGSGDVVFPALHSAPDAMFGVGKILELLALTDASIEEVGDDLPSIPYASRSLPCPMERKGAVLRRFAEMAQQQGGSQQEGIRIDFDHGWVMLRADRSAPRLHLIVEADSPQRAGAWLKKYEDLVEQWIREEQ
jgi:mannose-1-phosphate guanylyltransferase/phosphomannomutase